MRLERKALKTGSLEDCFALWAIPFYAQRKYWFKLFIGFNYGILADLLQHWTLHGVPDPTFNDENLKLFQYLAQNTGILSMEECLGESTLQRAGKRLSSLQFAGARPSHRIRSPAKSANFLQILKSRIPIGSSDRGKRRVSRRSSRHGVATYSLGTFRLTDESRQSKLSQEQLTELQRSTHFDKKELQQWYKGMFRSTVLILY